MIFNKNIVDLMMQIEKDGYATRKTQRVYTSQIGFFIAMKWLRDHDLIQCDGKTDGNFKIWSLNDKGKEVIKHLKRVREILKREDEHGESSFLHN